MNREISNVGTICSRIWGNINFERLGCIATQKVAREIQFHIIYLFIYNFCNALKKKHFETIPGTCSCILHVKLSRKISLTPILARMIIVLLLPWYESYHMMPSASCSPEIAFYRKNIQNLKTSKHLAKSYLGLIGNQKQTMFGPCISMSIAKKMRRATHR